MFKGSFVWVAGETVVWRQEGHKVNWEVHPPRTIQRGEASLIQGRADRELRDAMEEVKSYQRENQWWKPDME